MRESQNEIWFSLKIPTARRIVSGRTIAVSFLASHLMTFSAASTGTAGLNFLVRTTNISWSTWVETTMVPERMQDETTSFARSLFVGFPLSKM
jgi:hypothetical protein